MKAIIIAILALGLAACGGPGGGGTSAPARVLYRCECGKTGRVDAGYEAPICVCGKEMRR